VETIDGGGAKSSAAILFLAVFPARELSSKSSAE
jgi:hypothetical protein